MQREQLSRLCGAEPLLSYPLAGLSDQLKHAALSDAVRPDNLGRGRPAYILSQVVGMEQCLGQQITNMRPRGQ